MADKKTERRADLLSDAIDKSYAVLGMHAWGADTGHGDGRVHGGAMTALLALSFSGVLPAVAACAAAALMGWS